MCNKWWDYAKDTPIYEDVFNQAQLKTNWFKRTLLAYLKNNNRNLFNQADRIKQFENSNREMSKIMSTNAVCSLNAYFNMLSHLKNHLIILTSHADANYKLRNLTNRNLNLELKMNFRDSYIGIVNTKDNIIYENNSQDKLTYSYTIPGTNETIEIESRGFYAEAFSSIKFRGTEYSKQKRGLNILVLDLETLDVVDNAHCDTCLDDNLLVDSTKLKNWGL